MLSALIRSRLRYPAVHLAAQPVNRRSVQHGPLVLVSDPLKTPAPTIDRDRTVSRPVDMSSWGGSACYPRSTFYPLSDGVSIHVRRITKPQFPACSGCLPPSQAPFCLYTLNRPVTNRPEGTFGSLRYAFGGDHPSQTAHQAVSPIHRVRPQTAEGPYFKDGSTQVGTHASKPPAYPTHPMTKVSAKLQ